MICELDGRQITDCCALHDLLAEKLEFPDYYGRNLDALYDLLTEIEGEIHVTYVTALETNLGAYGRGFLKVLEDAVQSNPALSVQICENFCDNEK